MPAFLEAALRDGIRHDGRGLMDYRKVDVEFGSADGTAIISVGQTRVLAVVRAELVEPYMDRPQEGNVSFSVDLGGLASPHWEPGKQAVQAKAIASTIDQIFKSAGLIDTEALCVMGGRKVWSIHCDVRALQFDENLEDACILSAVAAMKHFRRQDVTVDGDDVIVHDIEARQPVGLCMHHVLASITFAYNAASAVFFVDPCSEEVSLVSGKVTFVLNEQEMIVGILMPGGILTDYESLASLQPLAKKLAQGVIEKLLSATRIEDERRESARVHSVSK